MKFPATATLLLIVSWSSKPCAVVLAMAPAAIARAASPLVTSPELMASTQKVRPDTAAGRFSRFSKMALTKLSVEPLPYKAVDSALVPKESTRVLTAALVL